MGWWSWLAPLSGVGGGGGERRGMVAVGGGSGAMGGTDPAGAVLAAPDPASDVVDDGHGAALVPCDKVDVGSHAVSLFGSPGSAFPVPSRPAVTRNKRRNRPGL